MYVYIHVKLQVLMGQMISMVSVSFNIGFSVTVIHIYTYYGKVNFHSDCHIYHKVACLSRSFVDVRACFEWAVSAMKLHACLVPSWM